MIGVYAKIDFTKAEMRAFRKAQVLVDLVNERRFLRAFHRLFYAVRCHELARAVGSILRLKVVDGIVINSAGLTAHSWLVTAKGNVLDVYTPNEFPMVQLIFQDEFGIVRTYKELPIESTLCPPINSEAVALLVRMMRG